MTQLGQLSSNY